MWTLETKESTWRTGELEWQNIGDKKGCGKKRFWRDRDSNTAMLSEWAMESRSLIALSPKWLTLDKWMFLNHSWLICKTTIMYLTPNFILRIKWNNPQRSLSRSWAHTKHSVNTMPRAVRRSFDHNFKAIWNMMKVKENFSIDLGLLKASFW